MLLHNYFFLIGSFSFFNQAPLRCFVVTIPLIPSSGNLMVWSRIDFGITMSVPSRTTDWHSALLHLMYYLTSVLT